MKNQFVIAPTYTVGINYLRSAGKNPREWKIIAFECPDSIEMIRGIRGGIAEDVVTAPTANVIARERLEEIRHYLKIAEVEIKAVHY